MSELVQKFAKTTTFKYFYSTLMRFDADLNCFVSTNKLRDRDAELLTAAWWMFQEQQTKIDGLKNQLSRIGYVDNGGQLMKPPVGNIPNFDLLDHKQAKIDQLQKQVSELENQAQSARVLCETACELLDDYAHQDAMVILDDLEQALRGEHANPD